MNDAIIFLLLIVLVIIIAYFLLNVTIGRGEKIGGYEKGVLLIPGLGNGIESFDWKRSTEEQRRKTGLNLNNSMIDELNRKGYEAISFDPFDIYKENQSIDEFAEIIYLKYIRPFGINLIVGHSIGGRVAQYIGEKYGCLYIMLDPTPDYIIEEIEYTKHLTNPSYGKTYSYITMMKGVEWRSLKYRPEVVVYSIDDNDKGKERKEEYFLNIDCKKIRLENATHWVHISNMELVLGEILKRLT